MTAPYLAGLNCDQRRAVEHGGPDYLNAPPLLIIAGAGSGKTRRSRTGWRISSSTASIRGASCC